MGEGMPTYRNPYEKGRLVITFSVSQEKKTHLVIIGAIIITLLLAGLVGLSCICLSSQVFLLCFFFTGWIN